MMPLDSVSNAAMMAAGTGRMMARNTQMPISSSLLSCDQGESAAHHQQPNHRSGQAPGIALAVSGQSVGSGQEGTHVMSIQEPRTGPQRHPSVGTLPTRSERTQRLLRHAAPMEVQLWLRVCRQLAQNPDAPMATRLAADEHAVACQALLSG
jgi:hypothetical protein